MNNGEFYGSHEHNYIGENKSFPAESYKNPFEENALGKELADSGKELTTVAKTRKKRNKNKSGSDGANLVDRLFGSIKSVAVTATVAVSAVAVMSTAFTSSPKAELLSIEVGADYAEYEIALENLDAEEDYFLLVEAPLEEREESAVSGDGTYHGRVEGLKPEWEYTLSLVSRDAVIGEITHFKYKFQTEKTSGEMPKPPPFTVLGVELSGPDYVRILLDGINTDSVEMLVEFSGGQSRRIKLNKSEIAQGYADVTVPKGTTSLTVTPFAEAGSDLLLKEESFSWSPQNNLEVETLVNLDSYYKEVIFLIKALSGGADMISVSSSEDGAESKFGYDRESVRLSYSERGAITYTLYLTNEAGERLSNTVTVSVDTSEREIDGEYVMTSLNPSQVGLTFNEDGSMNAYADVGFESVDETIYYYVVVGGYYVNGREKIAVVRNIPNEAYGYSHYVYKEIDGVKYLLGHNFPSGMVNEFTPDIDYGFSEGKLNISSSGEGVDLDRLRVVTSLGEEYILKKSDFVFDDASGQFTAVLSFDGVPEYVDIFVRAYRVAENLDGVADYDGKFVSEEKITVYTE